ncbi:MAG: TIR domain-containing protein [Actinophytocola sp.]|uniref:TIR domain-containing protein n=1 Tax=Actinophytocola sp. TaxID=1872138 RepID=UPI003D6ABE8F
MARQTFFSFHYDRDIFRVNTVRNTYAFRRLAHQGIFDHSLWERTKLSGDAALRRLIDGGLRGASVTVVLVGLECHR